jgi:hypothetical protein
MNPQPEIRAGTRRDFILKALSSCALCGIAAPDLLLAAGSPDGPDFGSDNKFLNPSGMTCQDVFYFTYRDNYIPVMKNLARITGKEKLLDMLKESSSVINEAVVKYWETTYPKRSLKDWIVDMQVFLNNELYKNTVTFEPVTITDTVYEMKVTECLWAKTFREADAADIGYAGICFGDYATTKAFNPKMKFTREKTLMEGADCCQARYELEA